MHVNEEKYPTAVFYSRALEQNSEEVQILNHLKKYLYIRLEQKELFKVDLSDLAPHHHLLLLNLLI